LITPNTPDPVAYRLQRDILQLIEREIDKAREDILRWAIGEFEAKVKKIIAQTTLNLTNYYTVERSGLDLLIRVKIDKGE